MTIKKNPLELTERKLLTVLAAGVSALTLGIAAPVSAQDVIPDATEADDEERDEVVVTGSRIRRSDFPTTGAQVTIDSQQVELRQFTNVVDAINDLPAIGTGSTSAGANGQLGANFAFVDALDCETNRTLTLVNGRRFVGGNQGTVFVPNNATGAQVDITAINPGFIERTEVITGKGGAIYGADAVCGVVNIITRDNFEGARVTAQGGFTEFLDGGNWRASGTFGKNFFEDRLNVIVGLDYTHQDLIANGNGRPFDQGQGFQANALQGAIRSTDPFDVNAAIATLEGGGTLASPFLPSTADGQPTNQFNQGPLTSGFSTIFGVLTASPLDSGGATPGGAATPFFPNVPLPGGFVSPSADPQGFAFFAPSSLPAGVDPNAVVAAIAPGADISNLTAGQVSALALNLLQRNRPTPLEFRAGGGANINPALFVGQFQPGTSGFVSNLFNQSNGGGGGIFPTIPNLDPATSALFPSLAVPLQFTGDGQLVPFGFGNTTAAAFPTIGTNVGGDGVFGDDLRTANLLSQVDRGSVNVNTRFDITENIRLKTEALFTEIRFRSNAGNIANSSFGGLAAGGTALPLFIDENPFLTEQARGVIQGLQDAGTAVSNIGGSDALFVNRTFTDLIFGNGPAGLVNGNDVRAQRYAAILEGDFEALGRAFNWETSFVYGRNRAENLQTSALDVEFALAIDAVVDPDTGNIVCRQQTLDAPEDLALRRPLFDFTGAIGPDGNTVPTQAQVDACVPINIVGANSSETIAAASANILSPVLSRNLNQQFYAAGSFGGEIIELPAGAASFNTQFEWRRETLAFDAGDVFGTGAARQTTGQSAGGSLNFFEGGFETYVPIFGGDVRPFFFNNLSLTGAVRVVQRSQDATTEGFDGTFAGVRDVTFEAGGTWSPIEDISFRGTRSRAVRSPSVIELFGSIQTGFSNGGEIPCDPGEIGQGPNPDLREANCLFAAQLVNPDVNSPAEAAAFLSNFAEINGGTLASTGGNPNLANEFADNWQVGTTIQPRFIPGLTLAADFIAINLRDSIDLFGGGGAGNLCFDTSNFAAGDFAPICDNTVLSVVGPDGQFVVPATNPLTGSPLPPAAVAGEVISQQLPFNAAFSFFGNTNIGVTEIRAVNSEVRYGFELEDLLGSRAADWGSVRLRGSAYWLRRFDIFVDGTPGSLNAQAGDAFPTLETRFDVSHSIGKFNHQLQWFRSSSTVGNVLTATEDFPEQSLIFATPSINTFNYSAQYQITDRYRFGFAASNITRATPFPQFDVVSSAIGRTFSFSITGDF